MRTLLARRDVRLLLAGQTLSMFGDWAMIIVFGIWAKVLTGSNADAGLVFFVFALASLVAPLGALLVDRVHKQPLIAGAGGNRRVRAHRPVGALRCRRRGDGCGGCSERGTRRSATRRASESSTTCL